MFYGIGILLFLELMVRVFHLHSERPKRYLDEFQVEKWIPNQEELSVTGNRKQNVEKYSINEFGFNSIYSNYKTYKDSIEVALVGDSYIEGFHEDYRNSLGQQIEHKFEKKLKVFEFGYSGYDLADQLHLINAYKEIFDNVDYTFVYIRYSDDLNRSVYEVSNRLSLNTPVNKILKNIKLVVYMKDIGLFDSVITVGNKFLHYFTSTGLILNEEVSNTDMKKIENFKALINTYDFDKEKYILLLDYRLTSKVLIDYLAENNFKTLDYGITFQSSKIETSLIYDQHWNKHGRSLIATLITNHLKSVKIGLK